MYIHTYATVRASTASDSSCAIQCAPRVAHDTASGGLKLCAVCSHGSRPKEKSNAHGPG